MSWYKTGQEGEKFFQEEKEKRQAQTGQNNIRNWRFKLKKGQTGYVVFLDDLSFFLSEHQFYANNSYYNYETCIEAIEGECPLCESGNRPSPVAVTTIIDLTEHLKKDGTYSKPQKKVMVLKQGGTERLLKRQKKLGGLKGHKFEIYRSNDQKGEATGTDLDHEKEVDWDKLVELAKDIAPENVDPETWLQPFDYAELFKPKSAAELRAVIGMSEPVGGAVEDCPFDPDNSTSSKKNLSDLI